MGKPSWFKPKPITAGMMVDLLADFAPDDEFTVSLSVSQGRLSLTAWRMVEWGVQAFSSAPLCLCSKCLGGRNARVLADAMKAAIVGQIRAAREAEGDPIVFTTTKQPNPSVN
jgi:hypothetical protein